MSKGKSIMDNPEKKPGNIEYTRRRKTKETYNTICVGHHYAQTSTTLIRHEPFYTYKTWLTAVSDLDEERPYAISLDPSQSHTLLF